MLLSRDRQMPAILIVFAICTVGLIGCSGPGRTVAEGTGLGAAIGGAIGWATGNPRTGLAIGAGVGAAAGAVVANEQQKHVHRESELQADISRINYQMSSLRRENDRLVEENRAMRREVSNLKRRYTRSREKRVAVRTTVERQVSSWLGKRNELIAMREEVITLREEIIGTRMEPQHRSTLNQRYNQISSLISQYDRHIAAAQELLEP